jgi:hypothetical protein
MMIISKRDWKRKGEGERERESFGGWGLGT